MRGCLRFERDLQEKDVLNCLCDFAGQKSAICNTSPKVTKNNFQNKTNSHCTLLSLHLNGPI
jgi:hypothetical protein